MTHPSAGTGEGSGSTENGWGGVGRRGLQERNDKQSMVTGTWILSLERVGRSLGSGPWTAEPDGRCAAFHLDRQKQGARGVVPSARPL